MAERRWEDRSWLVADEQGLLYDRVRDGVTLAVLMDIRAELRKLNAVLSCSRFLGIPSALNRIAKNTTRAARKAKKL